MKVGKESFDLKKIVISAINRQVAKLAKVVDDEIICFKCTAEVLGADRRTSEEKKSARFN